MMTGADQNRKVVIIPCSGIGKTYGTVSRGGCLLCNRR
jgi:hypothetical protein